MECLFSSPSNASSALTFASDTELVKLVKKGDPHATGALIQRHRPATFRLALRLMESRSDADDITQEALIRAVRNIDQFNEASAFGTWLYRITVNAALMAFRHRRSQRQSRFLLVSGDTDVPDFEAVDINAYAPDEILSMREVEQSVSKAVAALPTRIRTSFELRVFEELSLGETADRLATSEQAIKSRLMRARSTLRAMLPELVEERGLGRNRRSKASPTETPRNCIQDSTTARRH